jgi:hypothetical protein
MKLLKILVFLISILLILTFLTGCSDNKNYLVIIEKNGVDQYSFAKSVTSNDDKSVKFIDENGREQFMTGDYITIVKLKSKDQYLIAAKNNGVLNLIFAKSIISNDGKTAVYTDQNSKEQNVTGELTVIKIRDINNKLK